MESVTLPPRAPNLNAHAERFVRTIKESCLERMILFGEGSSRRAIHEFVAHYHHERNHQGLGNRLIIEKVSPTDKTGIVQCQQRLGGIELLLSSSGLIAPVEPPSGRLTGGMPLSHVATAFSEPAISNAAS